MKIKNLFYIGFTGIALTLSSCNLDNDNQDNYTSYDLPCANLVAPANGDEAFATDATYRLTFYYLDEKLTVSTSNLSLGTGGAYSFLTNQMPYTTAVFNNNQGVNSFSGGISTSNGIAIQNLKGYTSSIFNYLSTNDPVHPGYKWTTTTPLVMSYVANYDYTVKTFLPDAIYNGNTQIVSVGGSDEPFVNDGILYRVVFHDSYKKADVLFYNAKFSSRMPVTINFVLKNLDVAWETSGYVISNPAGKEVIPEMFDLTAAPNYPFTSFELINTSDDLTTATISYKVQMGPAEYLGTFNGSYVKSSVQ